MMEDVLKGDPQVLHADLHKGLSLEDGESLQPKEIVKEVKKRFQITIPVKKLAELEEDDHLRAEYTATISANIYIAEITDDELPFVFCDASSVQQPTRYFRSSDRSEKFVVVPFVDEEGVCAAIVQRNRLSYAQLFTYIKDNLGPKMQARGKRTLVIGGIDHAEGLEAEEEAMVEALHSFGVHVVYIPLCIDESRRNPAASVMDELERDWTKLWSRVAEGREDLQAYLKRFIEESLDASTSTKAKARVTNAYIRAGLKFE